MKRFLLVLLIAGNVQADDITVKGSNKTVIVNGPVVIIGNNNIVQIGNNNTVNINSKTNKPSSNTKKLSNKDCDESNRKHEATVNQWMSLMGKR